MLYYRWLEGTCDFPQGVQSKQSSSRSRGSCPGLPSTLFGPAAAGVPGVVCFTLRKDPTVSSEKMSATPIEPSDVT